MRPSDEKEKQTDRDARTAEPLPQADGAARREDDAQPKLSAEKLEERVAPMAGWGANHNEALLVDE